MIFTNPFGVVVLGFLFNYVSGAAYEININGQTFQVNVVSQTGEAYGDKVDFTDDFGEPLDIQSDAICSSLRAEQCEQVTNNAAKTPNLFNYLPSHTSKSVTAQANSYYNNHNGDEPPHLLREAMDDRTLQYLSRQNPYFLGTKPLKPLKAKRRTNNNNNNIAQQLFDSASTDPLKLVKSRKIKHKRKKKEKNKDKNNNNNNKEESENENENDSDEYEDVEVELYSNVEGDTELANALGLDDEELGDTVDRIVAQLVASYLDNDSEDVDVGQIFANEMSVDNGDVSMEQINLDEGSMQEMGELLNNIAKKHTKKQHNDNDNDEGDTNDNNQQAQIFALKFVVDSDENTNDNQQENTAADGNKNENQNENEESDEIDESDNE